MVGQTNADCDGLSPAGYGSGRPYEISRNHRVWTKEIARVLIAKQIQNISQIYGNRGNLSRNHREISKPNQNNGKSLREREGEREERT